MVVLARVVLVALAVACTQGLQNSATKPSPATEAALEAGHAAATAALKAAKDTEAALAKAKQTMKKEEEDHEAVEVKHPHPNDRCCPLPPTSH